MNDETKLALPVFSAALAIRLLSAILTTTTNLNPDSQHDAVSFGDAAQRIAHQLLRGDLHLLTPGSMGIYQLWGSFLAPFWLLPGPSGLYGRVANATLGAFAVYNVYLIARHYHSPRAGYLATVPMIFYPSFLAVHGTLLREAFVLFGITTVSRVFLLPLKNRSNRFKVVTFAGLLFYATYHLRAENGVIYSVTIGTGLVIYLYDRGYLSKQIIGGVVALIPITFVIALPIVRDGIEYLASTRAVRAYGSAVYLSEVIPQTVPELVAFSWIGAVYFLYTPFPWMVGTIPGVIISVESLVSVVYTIGSVWGVREFAKRNRSAAIALTIGLLVGVVLYGVGTANYGTGLRHRQMFLWIIFLFGGIGFANHIKVTGLPGLSNSTAQSKANSPD